MMEFSTFNEVAISADSTSKLLNCVAWNPTNGSTITAFKGSNSAPRALCTIGKDYILSALLGEPTLKLWTWSKINREERKMSVPGIVTAMAVSPRGNYCVAAINTKLYVWHVSSGNLRSVISLHFLDVNCIKFNDRGSHFVSGGKDNLVLVWKLSDVLSANQYMYSRGVQPLYNWADHTAEVTDIHVGYGGYRSRVATVSCDKSCRVYDLSTGKLRFSVYLDVEPVSVVMDPAEYFLFIGAKSGAIFQIKFYDCLQKDSIDVSAGDTEYKIDAHSGPVTCLSSSVDGKLLLSGSEDASVKVWDALSMSFITAFNHAGAVTNAFFTIAPYAVHSGEKIEPDIIIQPFKRSIEQASNEEFIRMKLSPFQSTLSPLEPCDPLVNVIATKCIGQEKLMEKAEIQEKLNEMQGVNEHLYSFTMSSFFSGIKPNFMMSQ